MKNQHRWTLPDLSKLAALHEAGMSRRQMANELGRSIWGISRGLELHLNRTMTNNIPWSEGASDRLRQMFYANYSDAQIAAELRVTRNAVIGRRQRMGLTGDKRPKIKRRGVKNIPMSRGTFSGTIPDGCKWPSGESPNITFCGGERLPSGPYCAEHRKLAYRTEQTPSQ